MMEDGTASNVTVPQRRRSSLSHAALREGFDIMSSLATRNSARHIKIQEETNLNNDPMPTPVSRRPILATPSTANNKPQRSMLPTPTFKTRLTYSIKPPTTDAQSAQKSILRQPVKNTLSRAVFNAPSTSSAAKVARSNSTVTSQPSRTPNQGYGVTRMNQRGGLKKNLRKSSSLDASSWMSTVLATPGTSLRSSGRRGSSSQLFQSTGKRPGFHTKSPGESKNRIYGIPTAKVLKPPHSTDKKTINLLIMYINDFLQDYGYPKSMTITEFNKLHVVQFFSICQFVMSFMGYQKHPSTKVDDLVNFIHDVSVQLNYPGPLTKQTLKNCNNPHPWPMAVTFLAWLCGRVSLIETPKPFGCSEINSLNNKDVAYFADIMAESLRELYCNGAIGDEDVKIEKEKYEKVLREYYFVDQEETEEGLMEETEALEKELNELKSEMDPTTEIDQNTKIGMKKMDEIGAKTAEALKHLQKYKSTEHVKVQKEILRSKIVNEKRFNSELVDVIANQKLSIEQEKLMLTDIEELKKQQEAISKVNSDTLRRIENRGQIRQNIHDTFYEVCQRLKLTDEFNQHLSVLESNKLLSGMERIPPNPFNAAQLKPWLESQVRVVKHTQRILMELLHSLDEKMHSNTQSTLTIQQEIDAVLKRRDEVKVNIETLHKVETERNLDFNKKVNELNATLRLNEENYDLLHKSLVEAEEAKEATIQTIKQMEAELAQINAEIDEAGKKLENGYGVLKQMEANKMQETGTTMIQCLNMRREAFLRYSGIDMHPPFENIFNDNEDKEIIAQAVALANNANLKQIDSRLQEVNLNVE